MESSPAAAPIAATIQFSKPFVHALSPPLAKAGCRSAVRARRASPRKNCGGAVVQENFFVYHPGAPRHPSSTASTEEWIYLFLKGTFKLGHYEAARRIDKWS